MHFVCVYVVVQFGYVTLFASAFPLAGLLGIVMNFIEVRTDLFKLVYVHQRPHPETVSNIGTTRSTTRKFRLCFYDFWRSLHCLVCCFAFILLLKLRLRLLQLLICVVFRPIMQELGITCSI